MSSALHYVINLLARREYSEAEIRHKMQQKAFSPEEIEQAIQYCQQKNWQSDLRFCESYIRTRSQRGYGKLRIKQELNYLKGIDDETLNTVFDGMQIDWEELALTTLSKKFPHFAQVKDLKTKQKIWRYMASHGFYAEEFSHYIGQGDE
ncbi:recombination regulator RecX [Volucribacter amazonae]|uniref:Regulatory protein RecX n=1 Tax=Volucribacter amazonae TaxID=256731 RepID=A0A9X4PAR7_9PAST|nr:recombination regulator RecX [Volucribacter amazonae]MDG6895623.1 recombination regulator RecX [Volucribacter amazonae]